MNIAISTVIFFIFLLPGITLRRFYYTEEFSKQYFKQNLFELFLAAFVPSIVLHASLSGLVTCFGYKIHLDIIGQLLTSKDYPEVAFQNLQSNIGKILCYQILIITMAATCGYVSKKIIRHWHIDSKHKLFRFKNAWHYVLTGEFFNFHRAAFDLEDDSIDSIDFVHIDVLVDTSDGTVIYDGFFVDYELTEDGGLETITLKNVQRRLMSSEKDEEFKKTNGVYYNIPGHILVIPYSSIINLNFSYYKFVEITGNDDEVEIGIELIE